MIKKVTDLRAGDIVVDNVNYIVWKVAYVNTDGWVSLRDVDPEVRLSDGSPVVFSTTWRVRLTSDVLFKDIEEIQNEV